MMMLQVRLVHSLGDRLIDLPARTFESPLVIGRSPEADVQVPAASVSRRHCAILVHISRGCELHDTASKNGTFLNGNRISGPTRLACGDEIKMCDHTIIFQSSQNASGEKKGESPSRCVTIG